MVIGVHRIWLLGDPRQTDIDGCHVRASVNYLLIEDSLQIADRRGPLRSRVARGVKWLSAAPPGSDLAKLRS
jgi:hypothetical protein